MAASWKTPRRGKAERGESAEGIYCRCLREWTASGGHATGYGSCERRPADKHRLTVRRKPPPLSIPLQRDYPSNSIRGLAPTTPLALGRTVVSLAFNHRCSLIM